MFNYFYEQVAELFIVFLSIVILKIYFGTFFLESKKKVWSLIFWIGYIIWQILISNINILPGYVNVLISLALTAIMCMASYEGSIWKKLVFSVLINAIWMLVELLVGYAFLLREIHIYYSINQILGSLSSKVLTLLLIVGLKIFIKNENIRNLPMKYNMLLLLIPIGSMFVVYNIFMLNIYVENQNHIKESLTSSLLILAINVIIFKLYIELSKEKELQRYNTVYEKQLELCNQHMVEKESILIDFRNARHNMKQHFIVLMEMLVNNENKLAVEYLEKLMDMNVLTSTGISKTENIVVDSLINAKYAVALKQNIRFEINIHIPMQLPFASADSCILLGNILDNAIEASIKIPIEKRFIKYFMKLEGNLLIITVINSFSGKINKNRNGQIISNKEPPENHGIGLESIRKVADKYHGSVIMETKKEIFIIKVIICDDT